MNKTNNDIIEFLNSSTNNKLIMGYEGSGKSTLLIDIAINTLTLNNDRVVIYATQSYEQLLEKQQWMISTYKGTEQTFPIIGTPDNPYFISKGGRSYKKYHTTKNSPEMIYPETKIVLCTVAYLNKLNHLSNSYINNRYCKILVDEFSFEYAIIPRISYMINTFKQSSDEDFLTYLAKTYSSQDVELFKGKSLDDNSFEISAWLRLETNGRVIFMSSEHLAQRILEAIGCDSYRIPDILDLKSFIIPTIKSDITSKSLEYINTNKEWDLFGFTHIIADKCDDLGIFETTKQVINHSSVRGSNNLSQEHTLTIITHIKDKTLQIIKEAIEYFEDTKIEFDEIKSTYYLDRARQGLGRATGYRQRGGSSSLMINTLIYDMIKHEFNKSYVCDETTSMPYTIQLETCNIKQKINYARLDEINIITRAQKERDDEKVRKQSKEYKDRENIKQLVVKVKYVEKVFEYCEGSIIPLGDLKYILKSKYPNIKIPGESIVKIIKGSYVKQIQRRNNDGTRSPCKIAMHIKVK